MLTVGSGLGLGAGHDYPRVSLVGYPEWQLAG